MLRMLRFDTTAHQLFASLLLSVVMVGVLVGNAYYAWSEILMLVGLVLAVPALLGFMLLSSMGLGWQLRGRESFVQSNPGAWVYCVVFYTLLFFVIIRAVRSLRNPRVSPR